MKLNVNFKKFLKFKDLRNYIYICNYFFHQQYIFRHKKYLETILIPKTFEKYS